MQNTRKQTVFFAITNLTKPASLYNGGMQPVFYSVKSSHSSWTRAGHSIRYEKNPESGYTLRFAIDFPHDDDTVFLAHYYPYTYSDLQAHLQALTHPDMRHRVLAKTPAGNNIDLVTITARLSAPSDIESRPTVLITARTHPGEPNSSFIASGILKFLTTPAAHDLRQSCVFKIVPMLNPDGVIAGNNRTNILGTDLNRAFPSHETSHIDTLARRASLFIDIHGHSRKFCAFAYAASPRDKLFPHLLAQKSPAFSFHNCAFAVSRAKRRTARAVVASLGVPAFCIEASFCGVDGEAGFAFSPGEMERLGADIARAAGEYFCASAADERAAEAREARGDCESDNESECEPVRPAKKRESVKNLANPAVLLPKREKREKREKRAGGRVTGETRRTRDAAAREVSVSSVLVNEFFGAATNATSGAPGASGTTGTTGTRAEKKRAKSVPIAGISSTSALSLAPRVPQRVLAEKHAEFMMHVDILRGNK